MFGLDKAVIKIMLVLAAIAAVGAGITHVGTNYIKGLNHDTVMETATTEYNESLSRVGKINIDLYQELQDVQASLKACQSADNDAVLSSVFGSIGAINSSCEECPVCEAATYQVDGAIAYKPYEGFIEEGIGGYQYSGEQDELFDFNEAAEELLYNGE